MAKRAQSVARGEAVAGYLFLLPWILGILFLTVLPVAMTLWFSFTNYNLMTAPRFVGLRNYSDLWTDPNFRDAVEVTFRYVVLTVPLKLAFALAVAMLLNQQMRGLSVLKVIYYLPSLLGASVAMGLMWRQLFSTNGLFNSAFAGLGVPANSWITDPSTSLYTVALLSIWQFGSPMIIFLAGLKQIPRPLYEAAEIDGGTAWQRFIHITLPVLSPLIFFNVVLQLIDAFQSFTPAFVVSGGSGGPANSLLFYSVYLIQTAFRDLQMGYASAMACVLMVIVGVITAANFLLSRYWVYDESREA